MQALITQLEKLLQLVKIEKDCVAFERAQFHRGYALGVEHALDLARFYNGDRTAAQIVASLAKPEDVI